MAAVLALFGMMIVSQSNNLYNSLIYNKLAQCQTSLQSPESAKAHKVTFGSVYGARHAFVHDMSYSLVRSSPCLSPI